MIHFDRLDILSSSRLKNCPFSVPLKDLTVLMGPNGCGKTTILKAILDTGRPYGKKSGTEARLNQVSDEPVQSYALFMSDLTGRSMHSDINGYGGIAYAMQDMRTLWKSSGERQKSQMGDISEVEDAIILIDEMDASLDWKQQQTFARRIMRLSRKNQVIVATHSLIVCSMVGEVYDVARRKWVSSQDMVYNYLGTESLPFRKPDLKPAL